MESQLIFKKKKHSALNIFSGGMFCLDLFHFATFVVVSSYLISRASMMKKQTLHSKMWEDL